MIYLTARSWQTVSRNDRCMRQGLLERTYTLAAVLLSAMAAGNASTTDTKRDV